VVQNYKEQIVAMHLQSQHVAINSSIGVVLVIAGIAVLVYLVFLKFHSWITAQKIAINKKGYLLGMALVVIGFLIILTPIIMAALNL